MRGEIQAFEWRLQLNEPVYLRGGIPLLYLKVGPSLDVSIGGVLLKKQFLCLVRSERSTLPVGNGGVVVVRFLG